MTDQEFLAFISKIEENKLDRGRYLLVHNGLPLCIVEGTANQILVDFVFSKQEQLEIMLKIMEQPSASIFAQSIVFPNY